MTLHRRSLTSVLLAALIVAMALALGASRADAAPVQLKNAQNGQTMEVLSDGTVALCPPKSASFRQTWEKESFGTIGFRSATSPPTPA